SAIRCDNGSPFGSTGACGLTRLSAWWLKLGIEPHFVHPASPQQNGRHERMHRTLKAQTSCPPASNATEQQARFDGFREHFNRERPHEALGQRPPAELYTISTRQMPERIEDPWYDADHQVRRVRSSGEIMWHGERIFITEALVGEV
ncbi:integrase core domain-containing protein, partial [Rhodopseudomonas sp. HC1]|uniref:integrase core domain-containing protein n=1 Tax=Rhodopseudomonas infernalis TaxID=2897386 RepID=UPI001EE86B73